MFSRTLLSAGIVAVGMMHAMAQSPLPVRVNGTVETFAGDVLTVKISTGDDVAVTIPADEKILAAENRKLTDIKSGDFVGAAAMKGPDGKLHAQIVRIFTAEMRGAGEGHRPMSMPNQSMTNATVATVAAAPEGQMLKLTYKGGEQDIEIGPTAKILAFVNVDRSLLKPGAAVAVYANKDADGKLTARNVQVEKDGVKPG